MSEPKKTSKVGVVVLLGVLLALGAAGAWNHNDGAATKSVNAAGEALNGAYGYMNGLASGQPFDEAACQATEAPLRAVIAQGHAAGPLPFLTREELVGALKDRHVKALGMAATLAVLRGDLAQARQDLEACKAGGMPAGSPLIAPLERLFATEGVDKLDAEALRAGFLAGLRAGAR